MGYFSNGTEGMEYEEQYCSGCQHYGNSGDCAVLEAHAAYNYAECNKPESILHMLIPRSIDGLYNEKCEMFVRGKL